LPRLAEGEGLDDLLASVSCVRLTAVPAARSVQANQPNQGRVRLAQLGYRRDQMQTGIPFIDQGTDIKPGSSCGPLDAVWAGEFDGTGQLTRSWRGAAALEIERDEIAQPTAYVRKKAR